MDQALGSKAANREGKALFSFLACSIAGMIAKDSLPSNRKKEEKKRYDYCLISRG
jgi:hypothetical protein